MKLDIEALDDQAQKITDEKCQTPGEYHPNWHDLYAKTFARLIVERCAMEAEAQLGTVSMFVSSRDCVNHSNGVKECAAAIRNLLED